MTMTKVEKPSQEQLLKLVTDLQEYKFVAEDLGVTDHRYMLTTGFSDKTPSTVMFSNSPDMTGDRIAYSAFIDSFKHNGVSIAFGTNATCKPGYAEKVPIKVAERAVLTDYWCGQVEGGKTVQIFRPSGFDQTEVILQFKHAERYSSWVKVNLSNKFAIDFPDYSVNFPGGGITKALEAEYAAAAKEHAAKMEAQGTQKR